MKNPIPKCSYNTVNIKYLTRGNLPLLAIIRTISHLIISLIAYHRSCSLDNIGKHIDQIILAKSFTVDNMLGKKTSSVQQWVFQETTDRVNYNKQNFLEFINK